MNKRLSVLGNSLALVIDKPIRKILGIGRNTILRVSTDGRRIMIEPTGELHAPPLTPGETDAPRVFDTLMRQYGLGQAEFDGVSPKKMRIMAYRGWVETDHYDDNIRMTMKRLEVCLRQLMAGASWEQAIRVALDTVPNVAA